MNKETIVKDYQDYKKVYDSIEDKNSNAALQLMGAMSALEHLCPELKESEDEKVRKSLKDCIEWLRDDARWTDVYGSSFESVIAFLEKRNGNERENEENSLLQGEQKISLSLPTEGEFPYNNPADTLDGEIENIWKKLSCDNKFTATKNGFHEVVVHFVNWYEKQGEKKPTDKVEPKFKVGDFIVNDYCMGKVIELTNDAYLLNTGQGIPFSCEHNAHLWTIQDAKDGDVLAIEWNQDNDVWEKILIFKALNDSGVEGYGNTFKNKNLSFTDQKVPYYSETWTKTLHPATREQRDLLFQKMHEAGYEWDAEHKQLKKIEQNPVAWDEEDSNMLQSILDEYKSMVIEKRNWLNSLKDRVRPQPKQEWSKKDEENLYHIDALIKDSSLNVYRQEFLSNWLKSLKDRYTWKPTLEQVDALQIAIENAEHEKEYSNQNALVSLMEDLKNL